LPTRAITGQQVIPSEGKGISRALSVDASADSSPSQSRQASGLRTTGMRLWSRAHSSLGLVVTMAEGVHPFAEVAELS